VGYENNNSCPPAALFFFLICVIFIFCMTYSVLVFDGGSGRFGVGVVSGSVAVGSRVPLGRGGLGVVVTQGYTNPLLSRYILEYLDRGYDAEEALDRALARDPDPRYRQVGVLTAGYGVAMYTGEYVPMVRGGLYRGDCMCIGNLLSSDDVLSSMLSACNRFSSLEDRILKALEAGSRAGGDARGDRSSAILIYGDHPIFKGYDKLLDLRVDYSMNPVKDLIELYEIYREAYRV